jgi:fatty acid desaturase
MTIDRIILAFAGIVILISVILAYITGNQLWLLLTGFVGLNLLQSAFTGFCPLALILKKLGKQSGAAF